MAALGVFALLILSSSQHLKRSRSHNSNQVGISGTVSYVGKPLKSGTVNFKAQLAEAEYDLLDAQASIHDGKFSIPRYDGPEPGWFVVSVSPGPEPHKGWRSGGTYVTLRPDDDGVVHAAMKDQIIVRIMPGRNNELHFRLN